MLVKLLKSKLHRARVTDTKVDYSGSIAIDSELLDEVGIIPYESVLVANLNNANRFETYVVPAKAGSGDVIILGAAAKLAKPKDIIIILNFGYFTQEQAKQHKPQVVVLNENNKIEKRIS